MFLTKGALFDLSMFNDVRILAVDNDYDTGALYTALLEDYGATVITAESIEKALNLLKQFIPTLLICEARFLGESVEPLIQQVRSIAENSQIPIPIFVISTFPAANLAKNLKMKIEAYQIKPIDLDQFTIEVWNLIQPLVIYDYLTTLNISKIACYCENFG